MAQFKAGDKIRVGGAPEQIKISEVVSDTGALVCACVRACALVCVRVRLCACVCVYVWARARTCSRVWVCVSVCVYVLCVGVIFGTRTH